MLTVVLIAAVVAYVVFVWRYYELKRQAKREAGPSIGSVAPRGTAMPSAPPLIPLAPDGSSLATNHDRPPTPDHRHGALPDRPPEALSEMPAGPPTAPPPTVPVASRVVDLVAGIRLPDELVPLVDVIPRPAAFDRAVFVTLDAPAPAIRDGLAVALEAIGTEARWSDEGDKAHLRRGEHTGWLEIHLTPGEIVKPGTVLFPTLPDHAVTVEFWTEAAAPY